MLIDVLLVVGDNGLGDGLTDGVDLGGVTTTGDADTDVDTGELVNADDQEGLVDLAEFMSEKAIRNLIPLPIPKGPPLANRFPSIPRQICVGEGERAYLEAEDLGLGQGEGLPLTLTRPLPCCKIGKVSACCSFRCCVFHAPYVSSTFALPKNPNHQIPLKFPSKRSKFISSLLSRRIPTQWAWGEGRRFRLHTLQWATAVAIEDHQ